MITPNILQILLNLFMYAIGPLMIVFGAFWYGHRQANRTNELDRLQAEKDLQAELTKTGNENQKLEAKRNEDVDKVHNPSTSNSDLIRMWNEGPWSPKDRDR